jgi:ABC-type uncharacterized transport system involved in gliding motility auxiliary subunit
MKPLPRRLYAIAAIVLATVIFVALNIAADATFTTEKLDLTDTGRYTLAQGTRNILANLNEPITLKFFYSKKTAADYAQINSYAGRVRDLLNQYAALAHGKIVLEEIDPEPFTAAEDQATANGLSGAPTESGDLVYFGLVGTNTIDGKETIAFFSQDREPFLEYDLSSLVYHLSTPKKPKLGIVSSLPLQFGPGGIAAAMQGHAQPFMIYQELNRTYTTLMLEPNFTAIPGDVDVLMIAHPGPLNDRQLYAIDQFVLRGGRALVLVDPMSEISNPGGGFNQQMGGPTSSDLPKLFKAWGIGYDAGKVLADADLAQSVQTSADPRNPIARYPIWIHLGADRFDHSDQVTASLQSLNLASVGALAPLKNASTNFAPLVTSSKNASLLDATQVRVNPQPQELMAQIVPSNRPFTIAARISGHANSAFPKGAPSTAPPPNPANPQSKQPAPVKPEPKGLSSGSINVIVLADSDIFDDRFWVRIENLYGKRLAAPFADNAAFVLNSVENLMGSGDLISLRTRATNDRPFTRVKALQAKAQAQFQQQAQALQAHLTETQERLRTLQQGGGQTSGPATLTPAQQAEIERFKRELVQTRTALRDVQHNLRKSIDELGTRLAFVNIALVPLLVALFAIGLAILRRRRRARAVAF